MKVKTTLWYGVLTVSLFVMGIILEENDLIPWKNYDYQFLDDVAALDVYIHEESEDHGFVLLNDSIMVYGGNALLQSSNPHSWEKLKSKMDYVYGVSNNAPTFLFLTPPYRIIKRAGSPNTFTVIQYKDTLQFELRNDSGEE